MVAATVFRSGQRRSFGIRKRWSVCRIGIVALALGCGNEYRPDDPEAAGTTSGTGGGTGSESTFASDGARLDLSPLSDFDAGEFNCDAVDFLFVIDNSSSMAREQRELVNAVPSFTASILDALPNVSDVRVGVIDTDGYPGLGSDDPLDGCPTDGVDCAACDYTLGALLTKPGSAIDPDSTCAFSTGQPWMDAHSPSFPDEFACVADVGTEGNQVEQQAGAAVAALSPDLQDGGCNDGFLREESLLIVLFITDEADDHRLPPAPQGGSEGNPALWYEAVVAAKGGLETNIVAFGLIGGSPLYGNCESLGAGGQGAEESPRLQRLVESFPAHFIGSVCATNYAGFFDDALTSVAQGCAQFIPG